jgi:hypothetical protein
MTPEERTVQDPDIESLFKLGSEPIQKLLELVHVAKGGRLRVGRAVALSAVIAWLPLLDLAAGWPFLPLVFLVVPAQEVLLKLVELLK